MKKTGKKNRQRQNSPVKEGRPVCKGNHTVIDPAAPEQLHGAFLYQAITSPNPEKGDNVMDISIEQVLEAKAFVDQNQK